MKKLQWLVVALIAFNVTAFAQDKLLTLDDIFSPDMAKRVRFGGTPVFAQWSADGRSFKQTVNGRLMRVDAMTGQAVPYYDSGSLAAALVREGIKSDDAKDIANSAALHFSADESAIVINNSKDLWYYNIADHTLRRLTNNTAEEKEEDFSPDGKWVSFVRGNNLFV